MWFFFSTVKFKIAKYRSNVSKENIESKLRCAGSINTVFLRLSTKRLPNITSIIFMYLHTEIIFGNNGLSKNTALKLILLFKI